MTDLEQRLAELRIGSAALKSQAISQASQADNVQSQIDELMSVVHGAKSMIGEQGLQAAELGSRTEKLLEKLAKYRRYQKQAKILQASVDAFAVEKARMMATIKDLSTKNARLLRSNGKLASHHCKKIDMTGLRHLNIDTDSKCSRPYSLSAAYEHLALIKIAGKIPNPPLESSEKTNPNKSKKGKKGKRGQPHTRPVLIPDLSKPRQAYLGEFLSERCR